MKELTYTSTDRIFSKLSRDLGTQDFHETDVVEWTGEALEAIDAITMYQEAVAFMEVKNHQVTLPKFANSIIQIAQNNEWTAEDTSSCTVETIADGINCPDEREDDCNCSNYKYIPVDDTGTPIFESDMYEYRPNINVLAEYINWVGCDYYKKKWTPVRLKNNSFFNSIVCTESNAEGLYTNSSAEYTLIGQNAIRFSFETGYVAIAYTRQMLDEKNYPMIPDHYAYTTAVVKYVTLRLMERDFYANRQGSEARVSKAEADWQWYCGQAGNRALMPRGIDQFQNLLEQRQYIFPRMHRYYQNFEDLSRLENRVFNDPDGRNQHNYGRGNHSSY
jgi:hypothetical protein